jgi:glycosyltransferase involved in cell wall biosynthesis
MKRTHNKQPFMSVVVISYNSAATVSRALDSLLAQDYPKDTYEIVFVNDGSEDNTGDIVANYPTVRYIQLPENKGISQARNVGLRAARGDIYVSFDSDCVASPDWLSRLAEGYYLFEPAGVGGKIVELAPIEGLTQRYINITGHGVAQPVARLRALPAPLARLATYILINLADAEETTQNYSEVSELYGANCSFPMDVLRSVHGWKESMAGIEDRDLSLRIHKRYPTRHFYAMHHAKIMHDPAISLKNYLLRPYRRGPVNYKFHVSNAITPPLFPFPFLTGLLLLTCLLIAPIFLPLALLLVPQLLYFWWPYRAVIKLQPL